MRILVMSLILLASSCAGSKKTTPTPSVYEPDAVDMISLQRTGCYGTCPRYEVIIFGNGLVSYEGKAHTPYEGKHVGQLSQAEVNSLFARVNLLSWDTYPDEYPIDNVDFPQFFLKYKTENIDKVVKGNTNASAELLSLSKEIDALIEMISLQKQ